MDAPWVDVAYAIAHFVGVAIVWVASGFAWLFCFAWLQERRERRYREELSITLGVDADDLDDAEYAPTILKMNAEKFSSELFRNRISDVCGTVQTAWNLLTSVGAAAIYVMAGWYTVTDSLTNAPFAWLAIAVSLFGSAASAVFSLTCNVLTGRYPGQASAARKAIARWVKDHPDVLDRHRRG